jgi:tRNA (cytidine/uridine-2'-O-)-methyltransferase
MPSLALYQPDIPQNAGNMLRLCACLAVDVHIIEPAGFDLSDRALKRAGMDYLAHIAPVRHLSFGDFEAWRKRAGRRLALLTTRGAKPYAEFMFDEGDVIMVGRESAGVPDNVH